MNLRAKFVFSIGLLGLLCLGASNAHADSYTAIFTCTYCSFKPTAPDVSFPSPTTIMETWDGYSMAVPLPSPDLPTDTYIWNVDGGANASYDFDYSLAFVIYDATTGIPSIVYEDPAISPPSLTDQGYLTFLADSPIATPEPSSALLLGIGLLGLLVLAARSKRLATSSSR